MNMATWVQILDEGVGILNSAGTLGMDMNLTILPSAMGKLGRLGSLILVWQTV